MGHEFSGIVIDNGGSKKFKEGDKVTALPISPCLKCNECRSGNVQICEHTWEDAIGLSLKYPGGFGGRVLVREDMVRHLPDNVTFETGAMIEPAAVALRAVNISNVKKGDRALVIGGGIIGSLFIVLFTSLLDITGSKIIIFVLGLFGVILLFDITIADIYNKIKDIFVKIKEKQENRKNNKDDDDEEEEYQATTETVNKGGVKATVKTTDDGTAVVKDVKSSKKSVTVSSTVKVDGVEYKVTTIEANAFANCKKATKIALPATVKTIKKEAFTGAKKVKTIVVKSKKAVTVKKGAFKGVDTQKITIKASKMSKKQLKKFKKELKKAGFKGKVKK